MKKTKSFSPRGISLVLSITVYLSVFGCDKPRYNIKYPVRATTSPVSNPIPTPAPEANSEPAPTSKPGVQDCSTESLNGSGLAVYGISAFAKSLPDHNKLNLSDIRSLFSPRVGRIEVKNLKFQSFAVVPRMHTRGYPASDGKKVVRNRAGKILTENFGLSFEGYLGLERKEDAGNFRFALLADDGALLERQQNGDWITVVDNQGRHSVKLSCSDVVSLTSESLSPFRMYYHQGPRNHIAHMLFWKKVESGEMDPDCGKEGQRLFFDPKREEPTQVMQEFLKRGWTLVPAKSFILPAPAAQVHGCFTQAGKKAVQP